MTKDFNLERAIKALQSGQGLTGKDGFLTPDGAGWQTNDIAVWRGGLCLT